MEHANTEDLPPLSAEDIPPGSNYRFRPLTRNENQLLNTILTRGAVDELIDTLQQEQRTDMANLAGSVQRQQDDLYRLLQVRSSIFILKNNLDQVIDYTQDAISILIRSRNLDFRALVHGGLLHFLPGIETLLSSDSPIGVFRDSTYCQHCSSVGHFPTECASYQCPQCHQHAPRHAASQCPTTRGPQANEETPGSVQAPLPVRPPGLVPTQILTRPHPSSPEEDPPRRRPPPPGQRRDSPPPLSRVSSTSSLSEVPEEPSGPAISISEAVNHVHRLSRLATITWNGGSYHASLPSRSQSPEEDTMDH